MSSLFELRGDLTRTQRTSLGIGGILFLFLVWHLLTTGENPFLDKGIIPNPFDVLMSYGEMARENSLVLNTFKSIGVNLAGYVEALLIALPIGFLIGLIPFMRGAFQKPIDAMRYVPLTAVTGLFIAWFGIELDMKVHFLAFGILIYLLPIIVQRIDEVKDVYLKTVYTIGASSWQTVKTVYIPSVLSRLSDDIRVLTAISWTYIIVAETINNQGGLGSVIWFAGQRFRRYDKVFAVLILIMLIGVFQDRLFLYLDKKLFPHKYQVKDSERQGQSGVNPVWDTVMDFAWKILIWSLLAVYVILAINEIFPFLGLKVLTHLFAETAWAIHVIFIIAIWYSVKSFFRK